MSAWAMVSLVMNASAFTFLGWRFLYDVHQYTRLSWLMLVALITSAIAIGRILLIS